MTLKIHSIGRHLTAIFTLSALILTSLVVLPLPSAIAAPKGSEKIVFSDFSIVKTKGITDEEIEGNLLQYDYARLKFKWAADSTKPALADGDTFAVNLPEELVFRDEGAQMPLDLASLNVGQCIIAHKMLTCSFNSNIEKKIAEGFTDIQGTATVQMQANVLTEKKNVILTLSEDIKKSVPLPGDGGISERPQDAPSYHSYEILQKNGPALNANTNHLAWSIPFSTEKIQEKYNDLGIKKTFDGTTSQTLTFTEKLGSGLKFTDLTNWSLIQVNGKDHPEHYTGSESTVDKSAPGATNGWEMSVEVLSETDEGSTARINVSGPFKKDHNYCFTVLTKPTSDNGKIIPGTEYVNGVSLDEVTEEVTRKISYINSSSVTIEMAPGYGTFKITKRVSGSKAAELPTKAQFPVTVKWTLPADATVGTYPNWKAPDGAKQDQHQGISIFNVVLGAIVPFPGTFPAGTQIVLNENLSGIDAPNGTEWESPVFKMGPDEGKSLKLTIKDQQNQALDLTNVLKPIRANFMISKKLTGDAPQFATNEFNFDYTCDDADQTTGILKVKGNGEKIPANVSLPIGTRCTVTERDSANLDPKHFEWTKPDAQTVTITDTRNGVAVASLPFVNHYSQKLSGFKIKKAVVGYSGKNKSNFKATYTCGTAKPVEIDLPFGGTEVSIANIPVGTVCTVAEDTKSAERENHSVSISYSVNGTNGNKVIVGENTEDVQLVTVTNTYTENAGTFKLAKKVTGDYTPAAGEKFKAAYQCGDNDAVTVELPADGTEIAGPVLPVGTSCTVTELDGADRTGYARSTSFTVNGKNGAIFTIAKDSNTKAVVENHYTRLVGGFTVAKSFTGDGMHKAPAQVEFEYKCVDATGTKSASTKKLILNADNHWTASVSNVPTGSCTLTEKDASVSDTNLSTNISINGKVTAGNEVTFAVTDGAKIEVAVTNEYTRHVGSLQIEKKLNDQAPASAKNLEFMFNYKCTTDLEEETLSGTVKTKVGSPSLIENIPTGATCEVTETRGMYSIDGYSLAFPKAQTKQVTKVGETVVFVFTNTYIPALKLPKTGLEISFGIGLAGFLVVGGLTLLAVRRRKITNPNS